MTPVRPTDIGPPITDPTNDYRDPPQKTCVACGQYHGGVNAKIACLENATKRLLEKVVQLKAELAPYLKLQQEVGDLNRRFPSHIKERGK